MVFLSLVLYDGSDSEKEGRLRMISCVNDVLKSLLDDILQSQDDGLLARGRVHLVKIEKDVLWQETLICLEGFK